MGLKNFSECISDLKKVLQLDHENRDAKVLLRQAVAGQKEADQKSKAVFASTMSSVVSCALMYVFSASVCLFIFFDATLSASYATAFPKIREHGIYSLQSFYPGCAMSHCFAFAACT